ncbi:UDP-N-acetylmuramate--L-alanine ligase [Elusimicrobiota bacterium]
MFERIKRIHFVGIGGIGMCGIAEVLINLGYKISGSDLAKSENVKKLQSLGALIEIGHSKSNIKEPHVVVVSSAIEKDNPEVLEAETRRIPVIPRAEMLAELMRLKYSICIAGTHGKTTTTSIVGLILDQAGLDPTVVIGGKLKNLENNVQLGNGEYIVAEADESDGSFMHYTPAISIVTNIDDDHLEHYGDMEHLKETFIEFLNKVPFYGFSILCGDDANIQSILMRLNKSFKTYGTNSDNYYSSSAIELGPERSEYNFLRNGENLGRITVRCSGMHNVLNSMAASAAALEMGISFDVIQKSVEQYRGVGRRLEKCAEAGDVIIYDDYAHHPTEINISLSSLKKIYPGRRLIAIFQPHRYTRTRDLYKKFPDSLEIADRLFITDIYGAGESSIDGVSSRLILDASKNKDKISLIIDIDKLTEAVKKEIRPGDIIITLGAGNIFTVADSLRKFISK